MKAVDIIYSFIQKKLGTSDKVVLGFCGGRNVAAVFRELRDKDIDWSKVEIFLVDERWVSSDNEESNYKLVKDNLGVGVIHPFELDVEKYGKELDHFDLILLSSGEDGHVASQFPGMVTQEGKFVEVLDSPKLPKHRMTASVELLQTASVGIILFMGEGKKEALQRFKDDFVTLDECPAKLVLGIKEHYVITDNNI